MPRILDPSLYRFTETQPSYWEATAGSRELAAAPVSADESVDVAIIGGGYTGLSAALHLARDHGIEARVLEAGHIGWGASGRNGGFCGIGGTKMSLRRQIDLFGLEQTRAYYRSQVEAIELVRALGRSEDIDFDMTGEAEVTVADSPAAFEGLKEQAGRQREMLGLDVALKTREEFLETGYDSPFQHGALLLRPTFGLHPLKYLLGLARAAERHGAVLHPASEVVGWEQRDGRHRLRTPGGILVARRVIVTGNGFLPEHLRPALHGRTIPVQSHIVVTEPISGDLLARQGWRNGDPTINAKHVFFYFRLLPDNRLLFGGSQDMTGTPAGAERTAEWLGREIGRLWPAWRELRIDYTWRGLLGFNNQLRPAIGRLPDDPSVMFGFGYQGNGVNTATWTGREMARWLARGNDATELLPGHLPALYRGLPKRFPFPALRGHYLRLGVAYHRFLDRIGR